MLSNAVLAEAVAACVLSAAMSAWAGPKDDEQVRALAQAFVLAEFSFDQASLHRLTAQQFVEISPKGEVDERQAVLSFYSSEKKEVPAPPYTIRDQRVRLSGDVAVITQTLVIGTPPRAISLSQSLTAVLVGGQWKLASSHSTPMVSR